MGEQSRQQLQLQRKSPQKRIATPRVANRHESEASVSSGSRPTSGRCCGHLCIAVKRWLPQRDFFQLADRQLKAPCTNAKLVGSFVLHGVLFCGGLAHFQSSTRQRIYDVTFVVLLLI